MKRRFILLVDRASNEEQRVVSDLLTSLDVAWWHFLQDSWLIVDLKGKDSHFFATQVKEKLHPGQDDPGRYLMAFHTTGADYWSWTAAEATEWIEKYWRE